LRCSHEKRGKLVATKIDKFSLGQNHYKPLFYGGKIYGCKKERNIKSNLFKRPFRPLSQNPPSSVHPLSMLFTSHLGERMDKPWTDHGQSTEMVCLNYISITNKIL